jgi:hypothetical protein
MRNLSALLAVVVVFAIAGCGSSSSSGSASGGGSGSGSTAQISHAKTKFVFHAGLAFGAFHRWIYKPAKAGDLAHPFLHKLTIVKAGLAGLFVYHELKLALRDAQADPTLRRLVAPITALQSKLSTLAANLRSGHADAGAITGTNGQVASISQLAARSGQPITEQVPSQP